jgi:CRP-like cAMP-binding protein
MASAAVIATNGTLSHQKASFPSSAFAGRIAGIAPTGDALDPLHRIGTKVRFARDMTIFNDGDPVEHCYKIVSGAVRLCKHTFNGRRQIAEFLLPGDYFGFWQFGRYSFTAEAVSDAVLTAYPQHQVERLAQTTPSMGRRLLVLMSERLVSMQDHLVMLGRQAAKERVASFLLLLAERMGAEEGEVFDIPMNRQDMADYLGLTVETVCRALSELKRVRLILAPSVHEAIINNMDALQNVVDNED